MVENAKGLMWEIIPSRCVITAASAFTCDGRPMHFTIQQYDEQNWTACYGGRLIYSGSLGECIRQSHKRHREMIEQWHAGNPHSKRAADWMTEELYEMEG